MRTTIGSYVLAALAAPGVSAPVSAGPVVPPRAATPSQAEGRVLLTVEEALALAFKDCEIEQETAYLTKAQRKRAKDLAGAKIRSGVVRPYRAYRGGKLVGTAYFDTHKVRTHAETLMVVVGPEDRVRRVELLAFAEPDEYAPRVGWYAQFLGRELDDELHLKRGIRGISGATLSARATTDAVRRVLALHLVLEDGDRDAPGDS